MSVIKLSNEEFLALDKENISELKWKDSAGNEVAFHAAMKTFFVIKDGNWLLEPLTTERKVITKWRFTKDKAQKAYEVPQYRRPEKGLISPNWYHEYIKMCFEQTKNEDKDGKITYSPNKEASAEVFLAKHAGFRWSLQSFRTKLNDAKEELLKSNPGYKVKLEAVPTLKVYTSKPRPSVDRASKPKITEQDMSKTLSFLDSI
mgnify:CR=1 FL=1|tara:strand:- start:1878 stop:2486 length:609 start_codon:yes stop_codon:yes gene_type:complete